MNTNINSNLLKIVLFGWLWVHFMGALSAQTITRPTISGPNGLEVNSYTGNLFYQRTDMVLPGQGLSIDATFSFNTALDTLDWGLGLGWTFTYNMQYRTDSLGIVILRMDGREDLFTLNNNTYVAPTGVFDELDEYQSGKFRLTTKYGLKYFFDETTHKKLTKIEDLNGNTITLAYSGDFISTVTNSSGRSLDFTWADNHLTKIEDNNLATTRTITYQYENNVLKSVTDPAGNVMTYSYDEQILLTQITDKNNNPVSIIYHPTGQVKEFISCESTQRITYHEDITLVVEKSSAGNLVTVFGFDTGGRVITIKNPAGNTSYFKYDNNDNLTEFTDYSGSKFIYAYDSEGNRTSVTDPLGGQTQYTYTTNNRLASFTDAKGSQSTYSYDVNGNLTTVNRPLGSSENYTYDSNGNLTKITDGNGNATDFNYDGVGNLTGISYPTGGVTYEYDAVGNITKISDPLGNQTLFNYNTLNQLTSIEDALNHTTTFTYDGNGNLATETDANGNVKTYTYDGLNRLVSVAIPAGTTSYQYDAIGNLLRIIDANGNSTQFTYNTQNLVTSEKDALGSATFYNYDNSGNLIQKTDANGNVTTYGYDVLNRLVSRIYPENSDYYNYDAAGNLSHAINNDVSISYSYDALNRLISKSIDTWNKTIQYTYDAAGNRATMTDPDGGVTTYAYDSNNRLSSLTNPLNQQTTFEYDVAGRITKQNNANGTYATYTYDNRSNLLNLTNSKSTNEVISSYTYTYDDFGNRLTMTDLTGTHNYTYDNNHRLTDVTYANGDTESFAYDGAGNRIQLQKNGVITNYSYNVANQILTANNVSYTFDKNGNMTSKTDNGQTTNYIYDTQNRLTKVELPDGGVNEFGYDGFGKRIVEVNINKDERRFIFDKTNMLTTMDKQNNITSKYTSGLFSDKWISFESNGVTHFYLQDGTNNITQITNINQEEINAYSYYAFGDVLNSSELITNELKFTGRYEYSDIGLIFYRNRFYSSKIGTFLSEDLYKRVRNLPFTINQYTYVRNNPINFIDPQGTFLEDLNRLNPIELLKKRIDKVENKYEKRLEIWNSIDGTATGKELEAFRDAGCLATKSHLNLGVDLAEYGNDGIEFASGKISPVHDKVNISVSIAGNLIEPVRKSVNNIQCGNQSEYYVRGPDGEIIFIENIRPVDPNEIIPPPGYSDAHWMSKNDNFNYKILFENDPEFATAPAQKVVITLPLDEHLNPYSLRLGDFGFGDFVFEVPENSITWSQRLDVVDSLGVFVDVTAGLDITKNEAFWIFESIDPLTNLASTVAVDGGFLPVNDTLVGNGEGFVTFTIMPDNSTITGDSITAQADILFDTEEVIKTNIGSNLVDAVAPTSSLNPLPESSDTTAIILEWSGTDDTSAVGISHYEIYVSKDGEPFQIYQANIDTTALEFTGEQGAEYAFFTRAVDNVGNKEDLKMIGEDTILIGKDIRIAAKIFLQGAYETNTSLMHDNLRTQNLLPLTEPYTTLGYTHVGGGNETTLQTTLDITGNDAIVDWIFLELRDALDSTNVKATRSALLQRGGDIVDMDGISPVTFANLSTDNYYLVVQHRNHLGVMSATPIALSPTATVVDFTSSLNQIAGAANGIAELGDGHFGLFSGDFNANGQVQNTDVMLMLSFIGMMGYLSADLDLNGIVEAADLQITLIPNLGRGEQFSNN